MLQAGQTPAATPCSSMQFETAVHEGHPISWLCKVLFAEKLTGKGETKQRRRQKTKSYGIPFIPDCSWRSVPQGEQVGQPIGTSTPTHSGHEHVFVPQLLKHTNLCEGETLPHAKQVSRMHLIFVREAPVWAQPWCTPVLSIPASPALPIGLTVHPVHP